MNLLSLGTSQRRLFAIHEPAAANARRTRAVVLCQPWGAEYTYAHRSLRQLALKLAADGSHVLRFDYYGTGDSGGNESDTTLAGCEGDVEIAMEALAEIADTNQVCLIGLRLGANIAQRVAARRRSDIDALILWDPLMSGKSIQQEMPEQGAQADGESVRMLSDIQALELAPLKGAGTPRTGVFVSDSAQSLEQLHQLGIASPAESVTLEFVPTPCPWVESATTTGVLPVAMIQRMVEWLR